MHNFDIFVGGFACHGLSLMSLFAGGFGSCLGIILVFFLVVIPPALGYFFSILVVFFPRHTPGVFPDDVPASYHE